MFSSQPFFVRLWFALVAFFSSKSSTQAFGAHLVKLLGKKLARSYATYINVSQRMYTDEFHRHLVRLSDIQRFFSSLLGVYEANKGGFFLILSSLAMKDTYERIAEAANPFREPYDRESNKDMRLAFLRSIDSALMSIPEDERGRLYQAARGIEWMRRFCSVPIERIILRFSVMSGLDQGCPIDSVTEEVECLASTLASVRRIPVLTLEALFIFSMQERMQEGPFDMERECSTFLTGATGHLLAIKEFKNSIPLDDFVRFARADVQWQSLVTEGGEDWFQLYKNAWKKRFEERWTEWNRLHRLSMLRRRIMVFLGVSSFPALEYHPWEGLWMPLSLRRELSLSFLKGLFSTVYPAAMMKPLKILLVEGDFYRRENLVEFTDAFSALDHQHELLQSFESRLSPKGDIGEGFELIQREKIATVKGKARLENLMMTTDSEVELLISKAVSAFRSLELILTGVLDVVRGGPYETLLNMASIQGKHNERYRRELSTVRQIAREALAVLSDAEVIEKESI
jgi:hypothetical protein